MLFEGNRTGADIFLRMIGGHFYVYFLCRPDAIIDTGVARDILKAGLASLQKAPDPRDEMFVLVMSKLAQSLDCSEAALWKLMASYSVPDVSAMPDQSGSRKGHR